MKNQKNKTSRKRKVLLGLAGLLAGGVITYLTLDYFNKNKQTDVTLPDDPDAGGEPPKKTAGVKPPGGVKPKPKTTTSKPPVKSKAPGLPASSPARFPLEKGQKGPLVKNLQQALIKQFGTSLLPNDRDNGIFGAELENALLKLQVPATGGRVKVSEAIYNGFVFASGNYHAGLARNISLYLVAKDFQATHNALKAIGNKEDYKKVSELLKKQPANNTRQSLVTATLKIFTDKEQQQKIRNEFLRMGLKYNGKVWSLEGLDGLEGVKQIITTKATTVWENPKHSVPVPEKMVLGDEITRRGNYTLFQNEGRNFLVDTASIAYYRP